MLEVTATGKNIEKAIEEALFQLKASREDVDIKILEEGGLFKKARVPILFKRSTSAFEDGNDVLDNFDSLRLTSSAVFWG